MTPRPRLFATLEGYAVEGGYDRAFAPATSFNPTIALGRHAGPGDALELWRDYEQVLELASDIGLDGVRLTAEWARIEPRRGHVDESALARYEEVITYANNLGLGVTLALVDTTWPSWLGLEAWLLPWVVPHVLEHAQRLASRFAHQLSGLVVFADAERLVHGGYLDGVLPPWRRRERHDAQFARTQIETIIHLLADDEVVGPHLVRSSHTIDAASDELFDVATMDDYDQIYVRALVRGVGPTAAGTGLLSKHEGVWRVSAPEEVLELFVSRER